VSAATRSIVQRSRRRAHLATLIEGAWLPVCDRALPLEGTSARDHRWHDAPSEEELEAMCRRCVAPVLAGRLAIIESGPVLLEENAALRAEVRSLRSSLASALATAKAYSDRLLASTSFGESAQHYLARKHEERVDRQLARIGR